MRDTANISEHTGQDENSAESFAGHAMELRYRAEAGYRTALLMPPPGSILARNTLRNLPAKGLLVLSDGTMWTVEGLGLLWNDDLLDQLTGYLISKSWPISPQAQENLRWELGVTDLAIRPVTHADLSEIAWPCRKMAVALCLAQAFDSRNVASSQVTSEDVATLENAISIELKACLSSLLGQIDQAAFRIAEHQPQTLGSTYNYLKHGSSWLYRQQFAQAYPVLLYATVKAPPRSAYERLSTAIDQSQPINELLAHLLFTTPAVLRCIAQAPVNELRAEWLTNPEHLVELLEHLRPELRPKNTAEWVMLSRLTGYIEGQLHQKIENSYFGRAWMREVIHGNKYENYLKEGKNVDTRSAATIETLRRDIQNAVASELGLLAGHAATRIPRALRITIDSWLLQFKLRRLAQLGELLQKDRVQAEEEDRNLRQLAYGTRYWPLIPTDYETKDRSRRIAPLLNVSQLRKHGNVMQICLGIDSGYHAACKRGEAFIVALFDSDNNPRSTAELQLIGDIANRGAPLKVNIVQHTAYANESPSEECVLAMQELLLHSETEAIQRHLRLGISATGMMQQGMLTAALALSARATYKAFERTLGEQTFVELVSRCRAAIDLVHARIGRFG